MMGLPRAMLAAAAAFLLAVSAGGAMSAAPSVDSVPAVAANPPVYVFRGGLDIFSTGMDDIADMLNARGVNAVSENFMAWREAYADIVAAWRKRPYPIALIGHSYGANTAILMAFELAKERIPVALLVLYDATDTARVPPNVKWVLNFRSAASIGLNVTVTGTNRFAGRIDDVNVPGADHVQIDKRDDLHKRTIDAVLKALGRSARASAG